MKKNGESLWESRTRTQVHKGGCVFFPPHLFADVLIVPHLVIATCDQLCNLPLKAAKAMLRSHRQRVRSKLINTQSVRCSVINTFLQIKYKYCFLNLSGQIKKKKKICKFLKIHTNAYLINAVNVDISSCQLVFVSTQSSHWLEPQITYSRW